MERSNLCILFKEKNIDLYTLLIPTKYIFSSVYALISAALGVSYRLISAIRLYIPESLTLFLFLFFTSLRKGGKKRVKENVRSYMPT